MIAGSKGLFEDYPPRIYIEGAGGNIQILNNHIHDIKTTGKTDNFDALGIGSASRP